MSLQNILRIRKTVLTKETIFREADVPAGRHSHHVVAIAVIANPYAGRFVEDLSIMFDMGFQLGEQLMPQVVELLGAPAVAYSKAAIVGVLGEVEHGHALIHPKLGKPMRAAVGGGKAVICSNVKVAAPGTPIDMPFGNKDDVWSFPEFGTLTVAVPDAPRPDEVVVAMAVSDGPRPFPRIGQGPIGK